MWGLFGKIFGSPKALETIVTSTAKALDALVYTDEERATAAATQREKARDQVVAFMAATSGQNIARRLIALVIIGIWSGCYVVSIAMVVVAVFLSGAWSDHLREASGLIDAHISDIEGMLILILTFYFGAPHVENVVRAVVAQAVAKAGVMTINEGRRLLRLPPVPDGDRLLQPKGAPPQTTTKETA